MNERLDLYLRAHTVVLDQPKKRSLKDRTSATSNLPKWPDYVVVFGCESRRDITQDLTFGFHRILKLNGEAYVLMEEGAFFDDDLPLAEREVLQAYFRTAVSDATSFPPNFPLLSRSDFIRTVFYKYARQGALLVGFDLCHALGRLARRWTPGDRDEWSLVLSVPERQRESARPTRADHTAG